MKGINKNWIRFGVYIALVVLINLVSSTLFFRMDLTKTRAYTLSRSSVMAVNNLEEPLTIRIFLSDNLPQPYNNLTQEIRDLMEEYNLKSKGNFHYKIYELDREGEKQDERGNLLSELATQYGIRPVQIQSYEDNEMSLVSVYMGLSVIQGDLSETIPALGFENNLEFQITSAIDQLSARTNALLSLDEDIQVKLVFSRLLTELAPEYRYYSEEMETLVEELNSEFFDRLSFVYIDPALSGAGELEKYDLPSYAMRKDNQEAQQVFASVIVEKGEEFSTVNLIERTLFGDRMREASTLSEPIRAVAEQLLGTQTVIGYLLDHGAPVLYSNPYQQGPQQGPTLANFKELAQQNYELQGVTLDNLPEGLETLVIAGVNQPFTEWELFQLDQFLLKGGSLAIFQDPYREEMPQQQMSYFNMPTYIPINTGLENLLAHHGINLRQAYLMDKEAYVNRTQAAGGGFTETPLPFAPLIDSRNINSEAPAVSGIKGLIMLNVAPLELSPMTGLEHTVLFSSSEKAWLMEENISLIPPAIVAPPEEELKQYPLAVIASGDFQSYFKDRDLPEPPRKEAGESDSGLVLGESEILLDPLLSGSGGKLFVLGSSLVLGDNVIDGEGQSTNSAFILNLLDSLTGRGDFAKMRAKGVSFNPIRNDMTSAVKTFVKTFNIVILPVLVILVGIVMWFYWIKRKKKIELAFSEEGVE